METASASASLESFICNELVQDDSSVWLLKGRARALHPEESAEEKYLKRALTSVSDLSVNSPELAEWVRDWSSEHHLSPKRSQLLSGFKFDRAQNILEIGCGCGAVTRFLGETFSRVLSVERSLSKARLSGLRTRDLESVSIVCAPFQEIQFLEKFDIIFVMDGSEFSSSLAEGGDRHHRALEYLSNILAPDGVVIMAIGNQFGVKYLEGHDREHAVVRTAAKPELEDGLRHYFPQVRFYYPFPDHELPDCVLSSEFVSSRRAAEFVSQMQIALRDDAGATRPAWIEVPTWLQLARSGMMEFLSNSFLVIAGPATKWKVAFDQLGVLYSSGRREVFATRTRVVCSPSGEWFVSKHACAGVKPASEGLLQHVDTDARWIDGLSLRTIVLLRAISNDMDIEAIFSPCRTWLRYLTGIAAIRNGIAMLGGEHVDSIWQNVYLSETDAERLEIIDREWVWREEIPLKVIVIRAIFQFLALPSGIRAFGKPLRQRNSQQLIRRIAGTIGVVLDAKDFAAFIDLEAKIQNAVFGTSELRTRVYLKLFLTDRGLHAAALRLRAIATSLIAGMADRISPTVTRLRHGIGNSWTTPANPPVDLVDRRAVVRPLSGQIQAGSGARRQLLPRASGRAPDRERPVSIASRR